MSEKIMKCPFCGGEAIAFPCAGKYYVKCVPCQVEFARDTREEAVNAWNHRTKQPNEPLTLSEVKEHLSKRHPHEIEPLYVVFDPPMPINYAPRWRDAYNLSQMVASEAADYGKTWLAYRQRPDKC